MLTFLGDVSMPRAILEVARRYGHEAHRVHDFGLMEASVSVLLNRNASDGVSCPVLPAMRNDLIIRSSV